ncbi:hypothetical protein RRF57_006147 [Xylaria bambusicola]|uniref:Uncharacterized protein n=1 Tax=Xylaria bambusicola TaxID=326684 RepID=A0AAN7UKQ6_9PEZI
MLTTTSAPFVPPDAVDADEEADPPRRLPPSSLGPVITHMTFVLPISRYDDPSAAACVRICPCRRRSSFQRRPSTRRSARS